jgi:stage II sporulation protein D
MKKLAFLFLILFAFVTIVPGNGMIPYAEADTYVLYDPIIKVGLYYGNDALPSANLANEIGSGYLFGYFDNQRNFYQTGWTFEEKITINKDKNMYFLSGKYYDSLPPSGATTIGAYHIDSGAAYASFDEALAMANTLSATTGIKAFPAYIMGEHRVRLGNYKSADEANGAAAGTGLQGATGVGGSTTCYSVTKTATGEIIYEFDAGSNAVLAVKPTGAEYTETWFKNYKWAGAFEYRRNNGNDITVINVLPVSEYTKGVLPYEMNANWHPEALKAQAVCAASYALSNKTKHKSLGFDVCNTTDCQVYLGRNAANANSDAAAEAVKGLVLTYDNKICSTVYHSSNGGSTESAKNIWVADYPYLQAVPDSFEDLQKANNGIWSFEYTSDEITWILQNKGYNIGKIVDAYVDEYTPAGNVYRLAFVDSRGTKLTFEKSAARTILNSSTLNKYTYSQRFTISYGIRFNVNDSGTEVLAADSYAIGKNNTVSRLSGRSDIYLLSSEGVSVLKRNTDSYIVSGKGWGHNVGMSQYGAKGMAERGYTFDQILSYYFTGAVVSLNSPDLS